MKASTWAQDIFHSKFVASATVIYSAKIIYSQLQIF